jgi:gluconolactonase
MSVAAGATVATGAGATELGSLTERYPDSRIRALDPRFGSLMIGNTPLRRIASGNLWAEGPAWNGVGRYLIWSDIPADLQRRWLEEDGHVSEFRKPSGKSNGNTFDFQGRQVSCQHLHRRVVRYEYDGAETVLADKYDGKPLNGPNDVVVHPEDGSVWFTDPGYGLNWYEGQPGELTQKEAIYRIDTSSGKVDRVSDEIYKPNGLCFSPDYTKLYASDTGSSHYPEAPHDIKIWTIGSNKRLKNVRSFASMEMEGFKAGAADGLRADTSGNIWAGGGWVGDGYDGVHVFAPDGQRIGIIPLPEICSNLCFGGQNRNVLFMTASQSVYAMYVNARGAHIT